jgi:hypothetical protein
MREVVAWKQLIDTILRRNGGKITRSEAARIARRRAPDLASSVLDVIGSWPSSDPDLRALQEEG